MSTGGSPSPSLGNGCAPGGIAQTLEELGDVVDGKGFERVQIVGHALSYPLFDRYARMVGSIFPGSGRYRTRTDDLLLVRQLL